MDLDKHHLKCSQSEPYDPLPCLVDGATATLLAGGKTSSAPTCLGFGIGLPNLSL